MAFRLKILITTGFLLLFGACTENPSTNYASSTLYVFGDSLSDVGNARIATSGLFPDKNYYEGRFSNGPNYADQLADKLATTQKPFRSFGTNYAFGGARSIEVNAQVSNYKQNVDGIADPESLYIVWAGGNDIRQLLLDVESETTMDEVVSYIEDAIRKLWNMGARRILVPNQPNIGNTPFIDTLETNFAGISAAANAMTQQFNGTLTSMLDRIASDEQIITIRFDAYALLETIINDPQSYTLTNVSEACYQRDELALELSGNETICTDGDAYLFWDSLHPNHVVHAQIAEQIYDTINTN